MMPKFFKTEFGLLSKFSNRMNTRMSHTSNMAIGMGL